MTTAKTVADTTKRGSDYRTKRPSLWASLAMAFVIASSMTGLALLCGWAISELLL